jgi:hypothetical protein
MFLVYATAFVSLSVCLGGLYLHAWRKRDALALDEHERIATCGEIAVYVWFVLVGASSALWSWRLMGRPATFSTGMPGMLYALLGLTGVADALGRRWARRLVNRPAQRVQGGMDAG